MLHKSITKKKISVGVAESRVCEFGTTGCQGITVFFFSIIWLLKISIYFWLCLVFVAAQGLSLVTASGGYPVAVCWLLIAGASRFRTQAPEHGLSSYDTRA